MPNNSNWLGEIDGQKRLCDITIPGSHDAGVYRDAIIKKTPLAKTAQIACQDVNFYRQASAGSRFFDARVYLREIPGQEDVPTLGHFAKDISGYGNLGGYGGTLIAVIQDSLAFVKKHRKEFIILRFSHTKCTKEVGEALKLIYEDEDNEDYIFTASTWNIAKARITLLRKKVVMVFDSGFNKVRQDKKEKVKVEGKLLKKKRPRPNTGGHTYGMCIFKKFKDGVPTTSGLCTCGEYTGLSAGKNMGNVWDKQVENVRTHANHVRDHLLFIYWQQTGGDIRANTTAPVVGPHARLAAYIDEVKNIQQDKKYWPNVISHDFVDYDTCSKIIDMNTGR